MISHILSYFLHQKIMKFWWAVVGRGKSQLRKNKSIDKTEISLLSILDLGSHKMHKLQDIPSPVYFILYNNKLCYNSFLSWQLCSSAWDSIPDLTVKCHCTLLQRHVGQMVADWTMRPTLLKSSVYLSFWVFFFSKSMNLNSQFLCKSPGGKSSCKHLAAITALKIPHATGDVASLLCFRLQYFMRSCQRHIELLNNKWPLRYLVCMIPQCFKTHLYIQAWP